MELNLLEWKKKQELSLSVNGADFIILEKPIQNYNIKEIANYEVQKTIWKGKIVYSIN